MDFSLSADQRALQASLARVLADRCTLDHVRAASDSDALYDAPLWQELSSLGVPAILVPEAQGGLGLTLLDAALAAEALGGAAAPTPFLGSALAVLALRDSGQAPALARLATGQATAAIALTEAASGARDGAGLTADGNTLSGTSLFVIDGAAPAMIVAATRHGGMVLLDGQADGVAFTAMPTIDRTRHVAQLRCQSAACVPLAGSNAMPPAAAFARVQDAAFILLAADMLGASQTMLDQAVAYAKQRVQFGRAVGSFQAVKHLCADMAARLEPCRALVWYAAHAWDENLHDARLAAAHSKAHLSEVSRFIARTSTEVHGGMGFTDLLGLHYWFKRVGLDRQLLGGPEQIRRHAARLQGISSSL